MRSLGWIIQDNARAAAEYAARKKREEEKKAAEQAKIEELLTEYATPEDMTAFFLDCIAGIDMVCPACGYDHEDHGPAFYVPTKEGAVIRCRSCHFDFYRKPGEGA